MWEGSMDELGFCLTTNLLNFRDKNNQIYVQHTMYQREAKQQGRKPSHLLTEIIYKGHFTLQVFVILICQIKWLGLMFFKVAYFNKSSIQQKKRFLSRLSFTFIVVAKEQTQRFNPTNTQYKLNMHLYQLDTYLRLYMHLCVCMKCKCLTITILM